MRSGLSSLCIEMLIILDLFAYWALPMDTLSSPLPANSAMNDIVGCTTLSPPFWRALPANLILIITFYTDHCTLY